MMTKYYVDIAGNYLGGFDGAEPPINAKQVSEPPTDARMKWDGVKYIPIVISDVERRAAYKPLSPAQVRLVLDQFGLLSQVEAAVVAGSKKLKLEWEFRTEFARDNPTLIGMATALGMTDAQLDQMFEIGITL